MVSIVEPLILDRLDVGLGQPFHQLIGTVGNQVTGLDPVLTVPLHHMLGNRECRVVGQQFQEIRRGGFQGDFQGVVVNRTHAQLAQIPNLAGVDRLGVLDGVQDVGIGGGRLRIHDPAQGEDEVMRRNRLAIRPLAVLAEMEGVDRSVVADGPVGRRARDDPAIRRVGDQPQEQVAHHHIFPVAGYQVGIQGSRLSPDPAVQGLCPTDARQPQRKDRQHGQQHVLQRVSTVLLLHPWLSSMIPFDHE